MMNIHSKLLGEDLKLPLFDEGAILDGGAEPLPVLAFIALCTTDSLSTNSGYMFTIY